MPFRLDIRSWIIDVRKESKIYSQKGFAYSLSSTIWRQRRFGFTLIEILMAVGILALLAGAIVVSTNNARDKGKDSTRKQDLKSINSAILAYKADKDHWPPDNLLADPDPILEYASDTGTNWIPDITTYINKMPNDPTKPTGGTDGCSTNTKTYFYCYQISADKKSYTLWAQLENINDPEIYNKSTAICTTSPPTNSYLNYCIKSPQ